MKLCRTVKSISLVATASFAIAACGGSSDPTPREYPSARELQGLGYDEYIGAQEPDSIVVEGEWTHHFFDPATEGAICLSGEPFQVSYRDGPSDEVLLYLQGGGACWDYVTCYQISIANTTSNGPAQSGIIDLTNPENPFSDFDIVYVPYCDGSVFIGDRTVDYGGQRTFHHGLRNLSVAVDVIVNEFSDASRIVVAGSSAGGYGTYAGYGVTRSVLPSTPIIVFNDSGPGVQNKNATQDVQDRLKNWDFERLIPESCEECGDQYSYITLWAQERDADLRSALYSYQSDGVISFFLDLPGPEYRDLLLDISGDIQARGEGRFQRFMPNGSGHTILLGGNFFTQEVEGTSILEWTRAFLDGSDDWIDIVASAD